MTRSCLVLVAGLSVPLAAAAQETREEAGNPGSPSYLSDRGPGVPTSMFGTYVEEGELLVYPFFEYYLDDDLEYSPADFGYLPDDDFRGKYRASEYLLFLGYGLPGNASLEVEAAAIDARLEKAKDDPSPVPDEVEESGLGDVQMQLNWSWMRERADRPELFSYLEVVFPLTKDKELTGTADWEYKVGTGIIRGFDWGTVTARVAVEYGREEDKVELGEIALEYLKRLSPRWRLYLGVEGVQDEVEGITELQWHFASSAFLKLNNAFGLTSKATDWAPELGIMLRH
jgi:hypothetical protein